MATARLLAFSAEGAFSIDPSSGATAIAYTDSRSFENVASLLGDAHSCNGYFAVAQKTKSLKVFRRDKEAPQFRTATPEVLTALAFSADGTICCGGGVSGALYVWQTFTGHLTRCWCPHYKPVQVIRFSADGSYLVTASADATLHCYLLADVFDISTGKGRGREAPVAVHVWSNHGMAVTALALSENSSVNGFVVSGSLDRSVYVWRYDSEKPSKQIRLPSGVLGMALISSTGTAFACCSDSTIRRLNLFATRQSAKQPAAPDAVAASEDHSIFYGHSSAVRACDVNEISDVLVSCADDGVIIWNISSARAVRRFPKFDSAIVSVNFVHEVLPAGAGTATALPPPPIPSFKGFEFHLTPPDNIFSTPLVIPQTRGKALRNCLLTETSRLDRQGGGRLLRLRDAVKQDRPQMVALDLNRQLEIMRAERQEILRMLSSMKLNDHYVKVKVAEMQGGASPSAAVQQNELVHSADNPALSLSIDASTERGAWSPWDSFLAARSRRRGADGSKIYSYVERAVPREVERLRFGGLPEAQGHLDAAAMEEEEEWVVSAEGRNDPKVTNSGRRKKRKECAGDADEELELTFGETEKYVPEALKVSLPVSRMMAASLAEEKGKAKETRGKGVMGHDGDNEGKDQQETILESGDDADEDGEGGNRSSDSDDDGDHVQAEDVIMAPSAETAAGGDKDESSSKAPLSREQMQELISRLGKVRPSGKGSSCSNFTRKGAAETAGALLERRDNFRVNGEAQRRCENEQQIGVDAEVQKWSDEDADEEDRTPKVGSEASLTSTPRGLENLSPTNSSKSSGRRKKSSDSGMQKSPKETKASASKRMLMAVDREVHSSSPSLSSPRKSHDSSVRRPSSGDRESLSVARRRSEGGAARTTMTTKTDHRTSVPSKGGILDRLAEEAVRDVDFSEEIISPATSQSRPRKVRGAASVLAQIEALGTGAQTDKAPPSENLPSNNFTVNTKAKYNSGVRVSEVTSPKRNVFDSSSEREAEGCSHTENCDATKKSLSSQQRRLSKLLKGAALIKATASEIAESTAGSSRRSDKTVSTASPPVVLTKGVSVRKMKSSSRLLTGTISSPSSKKSLKSSKRQELITESRMSVGLPPVSPSGKATLKARRILAKPSEDSVGARSPTKSSSSAAAAKGARQLVTRVTGDLKASPDWSRNVSAALLPTVRSLEATPRSSATRQKSSTPLSQKKGRTLYL